MYTDDDDQAELGKEFGRVVVRREHYEAGEAIMKTHAPGKAAFAVAEEKGAECRDRGDQAGVSFWSSVFSYLMSCCTCDPGAKTIILEAGEEWDAGNEQVVKNPQRRSNQPRSDKGE